MDIKIGVDARILSKQLTGIGRYVLRMCSGLLKVKGVSLYLYSPAPILDQYLCDLDGAVIQTMNIQSGILQQVWGEVYLPYWAVKNKVDVFWGPAHRLPRLLSIDIAQVVTIHDLVWKYSGSSMRPLSQVLEQFQMPFAVNRADKVVTVSQSTAVAVMDTFSVSSEKVSTILLASDGLACGESAFEALHKFGLSRSFFLFVGTLEPRKNLLNLLAAYAALPDSIRGQMDFVIAGGKGWGGINLQETVDNLKISKYVKLLGYVDESSLATLYDNAQFLAMPSLYEGFGLPLLEAMAYGTPVLTSNNSSMPEVAGDAGIYVDAVDVSSIKDGLSQMIRNDELRMKLAKNARINVKSYSWERSVGQLIDVFSEVVSNKRLNAS